VSYEITEIFSGVLAAVGTAHKPKHNIEQLLGPSPKDLAQMKQQDEAAKKQNEEFDNLLTDLDSEVKTAKQLEEEERRRREERIIGKKKEHLKSIEVLIDQLELPDDEEEEPGTPTLPQNAKSSTAAQALTFDLFPAPVAPTHHQGALRPSLSSMPPPLSTPSMHHTTTNKPFFYISWNMQ
jgi:hypothetical protein